MADRRFSGRFALGRKIRSGISLKVLIIEATLDRLGSATVGASHERGRDFRMGGVCLSGDKGFGPTSSLPFGIGAPVDCWGQTSFGIRTPSKIVVIPFFNPGLNFCIIYLLR
jgi:hypothetical protein